MEKIIFIKPILHALHPPQKIRNLNRLTNQSQFSAQSPSNLFHATFGHAKQQSHVVIGQSHKRVAAIFEVIFVEVGITDG